MEDRAAAMPAERAATIEGSGKIASQAETATTGPLRLSGTVPVIGVGTGNAAYLFGWVAMKRSLAVLGRWIGVHRQAHLVVDKDRCTYREELSLLGLDAQSSEEIIAWRNISSLQVARVSSTWPVILGALFLLAGATWGLLRIVEGVFGRDPGLLARGVGVLVVALALDMSLAFLASQVLPGRWQVVLHLTNGEKRALETSCQNIEPIRAFLSQKITVSNR